MVKNLSANAGHVRDAGSVHGQQGDHLQELLLLHYIDGLTWEDVALAMMYSVRQIHNLHGIALQQVNAIMNDCLELHT